jgi:Uma2 family endonuclease
MMNLQSRATIFPQPMRLRFSVDEYYKMIDLGLIKDSEKAEIIDGELIRKMTIGEKHASAVNFLNRFLVRRLDDSILVSVQNPLRLSDFDEPEPDIVLADLTKYDGKRHPRANETILVVEVSDTTLKYDRDTKLPLYAQAEIQEVWIVNLIANIIEVHQNPSNGLYQLTKIYSPGETLRSVVLPDLELSVDQILV